MPDSCVPELVGSEDTERDLLEFEAVAAVRECIGELSSNDQQVLLAVLRDERGHGATFRKRLERALGRFRAKWSTRYGENNS